MSFSRVASNLFVAIFPNLKRSIEEEFATNNPIEALHGMYISEQSPWPNTDKPIYSPFIVWQQKIFFFMTEELWLRM